MNNPQDNLSPRGFLFARTWRYFICSSRNRYSAPRILVYCSDTGLCIEVIHQNSSAAPPCDEAQSNLILFRRSISSLGFIVSSPNESTKSLAKRFTSFSVVFQTGSFRVYVLYGYIPDIGRCADLILYPVSDAAE